jgi:tetratricopeptide (TPR) repeat protein
MEPSESDTLVLTLNRKAMDHLRNEDFKSSLFFLQKAESLINSVQLENRKKLYGLTLNNFGCYYKRTNKLPVALNFLKKALEVQSQPPVDLNNLAGTHLNICAILSNMNEHSKALAHSLKALNLLKSRVIDDGSLLTAYVAAHHNAGVEYEHLNQSSEAENIFRKGFKIASDQLGAGHPLTESLKMSIVNLIRPVQVKERFDRKTCFSRGSPTGNKSKTLLIRRNKSASKNQKFHHLQMVRNENLRFLTGDRLQPMFRKDEVEWKEVNRRKVFNSSVLVKEDQVEKEEEESEGLDIENEVKVFLENIQGGEKNEMEFKSKHFGVSIATQVERFDSNFFLSMQEKAAIIIQKNIRRYLAKRHFQLLKYQKMLKEAEKQAKEAKAKLKTLRKPKPRLIPPVQTSSFPLSNPSTLESIPVAYKDKLDSPQRQSSTRMSRIYNRLTTIIEENDSILFKVIKIQAHYRGWKQRRDYLIKRGSAILIQKNLRRHQVQRLYLKIRDAIIFIQASWRRFLRRHPLKKCFFHSLSRKKKY